MGMRNIVTPNINITAQRGWCLKYVDDAVNAPSRKPTAKASYEQEVKNGNIRSDIAVGVWVPGYLSFAKGQFVNYGHVFWAYKHADGRVEIHDSEVHSGARKPYYSIAELLAWFKAYSPSFIGYTMGIDGIHIVEEFADPVPEPTPEPQVPTYTVQPNDTLGQIILDQGWATDAGLWGANGDVARIAAANGIADANLIHPGQVIRKA